MPTLTRREMLAALATFAMGCGESEPHRLDGGADAGDPSDVPEDLDLGPAVPVRFAHGVASGDPLGDRVILWTRLTPAAAPPADAQVRVAWVVARDIAMTDIVARGSFVTDARRDWTVKVDVGGLTPGQTYYYSFAAGDKRSPLGRTRTTPAERVARVRLAAVSCASLAHGYFHVYRDIARRPDLDLVVHLGDYIYEYPSGLFGDVRPYDPPTETVSLDDYRRRYAQYRTDPDVQAMHRQHPMAAVWDDHEFANNAWHKGTDGVPVAAWRARADAARRAWFEWMPTREMGDDRIYRRLRFGELADLLLLDTRYEGRDAQKTQGTSRLLDPSRSILGAAQERWLYAQLSEGGARWRIIGQQVIMAARPNDLNVDAWDGYPPARDRLFAALRGAGVGDPVVLTGDAHTSWAFDLAPDPRDPRRYDPRTGEGSLGVELVAPGVTAPSLLRMGIEEEMRMHRDLPHLAFVDLTRRGWVLVDLTESRMQAVWYLLADGVVQRNEPSIAPAATAVLESRAGTRHLTRVREPDAPPVNAPPLAP